MPDCPAHLDERAKSEWQQIGGELLELGMLARIDRAALAGYCVAYSRWANAEEQIGKSGEVLKSEKTGNPYPNPFIHIANRAMKQMKEFLIEFGMTPASRSKVRTPPAKDALDEFEELQQQGRKAARKRRGGR
jgi:P27 family predicted phage terminase small subunit